MIKLLKKKASIEEEIHLIQTGDEKLREKVINDYFLFIIQVLSKVLNRYIEVENDPYLSVGLEAFNKALDKYKKGKGSFKGFAETVIRNSVLDELRKEKKDETIYVDVTELHQVKAEDVFELKEQEDEVFVYKHMLSRFDIDFELLIEEKPKHQSTRKDAIRAGTIMAESDEMMDYLYERKKIPRKALSKRTQLTEKKIKYNRSFIIAVAVALKEEIVFVSNYIKGIGGD